MRKTLSAACVLWFGLNGMACTSTQRSVGLYSAHSVEPSVNYDTPIKTLMRNPDGMSYLIENWGGGSASGMVDYYVHFPAFELRTHNGTFTRSDGVTTVGYRAVLQ